MPQMFCAGIFFIDKNSVNKDFIISSFCTITTYGKDKYLSTEIGRGT